MTHSPHNAAGPPASREHWPRLSGCVLGGYLLLDDGLPGGQGRYYKARDPLGGPAVGVKVLQPRLAASAELLRRFKREGALLKEFEHPHIVKGFDVGTQAGLHFIVMEHLDGRTLSQMMRLAMGRPDDGSSHPALLPPERVYAILEHMARALTFFHEAGYVHRDIKPSNIVWTSEGAAKLIDLGTFWDEIEPNLAENDVVMGTIQYMSPEQAAGDNEKIDHRSDIYNLGMTLLHLMTGHRPFPDAEPALVLTKQLTDEPEMDDHVLERYCADAVFIVRKMIEKHPDMRFQTPAELLRDVLDMDLDKPARQKHQQTTVVHRGPLFEPEGTGEATSILLKSDQPVQGALLAAVRSGRYPQSAFEMGQVLFYELDESDDVYVMLSGEVEVLRRGRLLARNRDAGVVYGEMAALLGNVRSATVRCRTTSEFAVLSRHQYLKLLKEHPDLAINAAQQIGARLTRTNAKLVESMTRLGTLEKRIKRLFARESAEEMDAVRLADIRADLLELIAEDGDEGA
ncbi:MAG: protein kinase [Deltaproteobacteria bacterium]|nr:protein kinase [Deltaproteobacteria bacterium]